MALVILRVAQIDGSVDFIISMLGLNERRRHQKRYPQPTSPVRKQPTIDIAGRIGAFDSPFIWIEGAGVVPTGS